MKRRKHAVRLLRIAEDDLTEIVTFIAADKPSAAETLAAKIEKNLARLARHPHLGKIPNEEELVQLGYRYLIVENFLIFYTVDGHTVLIHRILHGARDYRSLL